MRRMRWVWPLLLLGSCDCGPGPEAPQPGPSGSGHFDRFHGLVNASLNGDVETAKFLAGDLRPGDMPDVANDGGALEKIGGGLGFLQMAQSSDEVLDGLSAVVVGCGSCHEAAGIGGKRMGPWEHPSAGLKLSLGAVFPPVEPPPPKGPELTAVRAAWDAAEGSEQSKLAAAYQACVACHADQ